MEIKNSPLVRRQDGPDLVFYDDAHEPRVIKTGEWISAIDEIAKLPDLGDPVPLPEGATPTCKPFTKAGKAVCVFSAPSSVRAQQALNDINARPDTAGEIQPIRLNRLRAKEEDTSPVGAVITLSGYGALDVSESCVRTISVTHPSHESLRSVINELPATVGWLLVQTISGGPLPGQFLSAVEVLDRRKAAFCKIQCGIVGSRKDVLDIIDDNDNTRPEDLPKLAAAKGLATIDEHGSVISMAGVTVAKGRPKKSPVGIVVTVHDALRATSLCLKSLEEMDCGGGLNPRVYIIDDCSSPYVSEAIEATAIKNKWKLIRNESRIGYTLSVTLGIELAYKDGCEWAACLNSDTLVTNGWLYRMVRAGETDPKIGMVGPYSNQAVHQSVPQWLMQGDDPVSLAEKFAFTSKRCYPDALTPTGFCLLIRKSAWVKCGPFDHATYGEAYGEETEMWAQLIKAGMRAVLADDTFVWHQGHASYGVEQSQVSEGFAAKTFRERHGPLMDREAAKYNATADESIRYQAARTPRLACSTRPRLAFFLHEYGLYGGVLAITNIANRLIVKGWDVRFAVRSVNQKAMDALPSLTHPVSFGSKANFINHFAEEVFSEGILCATVWDTALPVAEVARKHRGIKTCYFVQDDETTFTDGANDRFVAEQPVVESYKMIEKKIINSLWVKERIEHEHKHKQTGCVYIPVGVDTSLFHPRKREDKTKTVLFFCRPETPRRGADLVHRVCKELAAKHPNIRLITYGGTVGDYPSSVEQLGTISQKRVADLYSQADVFLEASHTQGFGLQGLEAMASGCALVSTRNRGIDNYGVVDENCLLVEIGDEKASVNAILDLVKNTKKRKQLVEAGFKTAREFDWWGIADKWDTELKTLL